jgi:hypothetical protein
MLRRLCSYVPKKIFSITNLGPKFIAAVLLKFFISEIELFNSERSDFMELAFISEVVICCSRCDELCTRWLVAALLDVVLETICKVKDNMHFIHGFIMRLV